MTVSKRTRFEVLRRDAHTCRYCRAVDQPLTVDHVVPTALGGSDDPSNLVAACRDCNAGKSSTNPDAGVVAQVSDDAVRWAAAIRQAAQNEAAERAATGARVEPIWDLWEALTPSYARSRAGYQLPIGWEESCTRLLDAGLSDDQLLRAAQIAFDSRATDRFRYMMGVCQRMLTDLHDRARALLAQPAPPARHEDDDSFWAGWRTGLMDCSAITSVVEDGNQCHPDHYLMLALSVVVDAPAHRWAAETFPYPHELYPTYTGRRA